jgi:hypothetical protein
VNENGVTVRIGTGYWDEAMREDLAHSFFRMGFTYTSTYPIVPFPGSEEHRSFLIHCTTQHDLTRLEEYLKIMNILYDKLSIDMKGHGNGSD